MDVALVLSEAPLFCSPETQSREVLSQHLDKLKRKDNLPHLERHDNKIASENKPLFCWLLLC